jgi:hypothetical protein
LGGARPREADEGVIDRFIILDPDGNEGVGGEDDGSRLDHMAVQVTVSVHELVNNESVADPEFDSIIAIDFKAVRL